MNNNHCRKKQTMSQIVLQEILKGRALEISVQVNNWKTSCLVQSRRN
jgi:hypothetical protein